MRQRRIQIAAAVAAVSIAAVAVTSAVAGGGIAINERLSGFQEVPVVSSKATGRFEATVSGDQIEWKLNYKKLQGDVTQAHIHFGQRDVNGGISVWLCGNPSPTVTPPAGTQTCPPAPASISGTATAANVVGPAGQGIAAGEFNELLTAIEAGKTYANVHSTMFGGGEMRAQLRDD